MPDCLAVIIYAPESSYATPAPLGRLPPPHPTSARFTGDAGKDKRGPGTAGWYTQEGGRSGGGEEEAGEDWRKIYDLDLGERGG